MYIKRITGECYGVVCVLKSHYIDNGLFTYFLSQPFKPKPYQVINWFSLNTHNL